MKAVLLIAAVVFAAAGAAPAAENMPVAVQVRENQTTYMIHFGGGSGAAAVTRELFDVFYEETVAPRFPSGTTIFLASGRWLDPKTAAMVKEETFVVEVEENAGAEAESDAAVDEIAGEYVRRYGKANVACFIKKYPGTSAKIHYPAKNPSE